MKRGLRRIRNLWHRRELDREFDDEIAFHFEQRVARNLAKGLGHSDAEQEARLHFGSTLRAREGMREAHVAQWLPALGRDVRVAVRQLLKSPGFTLVALVGLALGIGANVAVFSVINSVLLRPLPYPESDRLVRLASTDQAHSLVRIGFSYSRFLEVEQRQQVFSDLALSAGNEFTLTGRGEPEQVLGLRASAALLPTLGVRPIIGRNFSRDEDQRGGPHVVLISHRMWRQRFNADPAMVGQSLTLDGAPYAIVGVLPEAATAFPLDRQQVWVPRPADVPYLSSSQLEGGSYFFRPIARLKPGVSLEQAHAAMEVIAAGYRAAHPGNIDAPSTIELVPLLDDAVGAERQSYSLLFGAVACVLLIACANIANLLLARFAGRRKEFATRLAVGANRAHVVRQLVSESMVLAALGGAAGVALAAWTLRVVKAYGVDLIARRSDISIDPTALAFALMVTVLTGLLIGVLPALQTSDVNVLDALKEAGRGAIGARRRLRAVLLVAEVALSLVLLIAAGLLLASFSRLQRVDPGFQPDGIFTAQIALPRQYSRDRMIEFYEQLPHRLATLPGVSSAAFSDIVPLIGDQPPTVVAVAGRPLPPLSERSFAHRHLVSPHYFSTLRIPLRAGRDFDERDNARVPQVVIINDTFARTLFPGEDPIGHTLVTGMAQQAAQVIGVAADVREYLNTPPQPEYFLPAMQRPEALTNVLVRSRLPPAAVASLVRDAIRAIDPDLPLLQPDALTTRIGQTVANRKLALMLVGAFAALALVLASLGVYSVMTHMVAFRTSEIGLRIALGAPPHSVLRNVLGQSRRLTLVGIALGLVGALMVSRLMQQALFDVSPVEPLVYIAVSITLLLAAESASFFPARRATRIDPIVALRAE